MERAFKIEGIDTQANSVICEIDRAILAPIANLLQVAPEARSNNTHVAIRALGGFLRNAAKVLYGEAEAEQFGFDVFDPVETEADEEQPTGTGG